MEKDKRSQDKTSRLNLKRIKAFLKTAKIPKTIRISKGEEIINVPRFIETHIEILERNPKNLIFKPYYMRLSKLYRVLKKNL